MEELQTQLYTHQFLNNGLEVFIYSHPEIKDQFAQYMVHVGGNDVKVGMAHFLEHTKFARPEGDWFDAFSKTGADCNAYTNYHQTAYYFMCNDHFFENLEILTQMMSDSNFTPEVVNKEFNIISQEINMYDQMPEWVITNALLANIDNGTYQHDIAGTIDDIKQIDYLDLQHAFDTYYHTHNMSLSICTKYPAEEVIKWLEDNCQIKTNGECVEFKPLKRGVKVDDQTLHFDGHTSLMSYAYKFDFNTDIHNRMIDYITLQIVELVVYSGLNPQYINYQQSGLFNDSLTTGCFLNEDLCFYGFDVMSDNKQIIAALDKLWDLNVKQIEVGLKQLLAKQVKVLSNKRNFIRMVQDYQSVGFDWQVYFDLLHTIEPQTILTCFNNLSNSYEKCLVTLKK